MKIFLSADIEGVAGAVSWRVQGNPGGREYEQFRRLLTAEVNAAIEGACLAGGLEFLVSDGHGDGQNIDVELLNPIARLTRGYPRALGMMGNIDGTFDAAIFIGYHAEQNAGQAVMAHTFTGRMSVAVNGKPCSEAVFNAAVAGHFGVPLVFISGDKATCENASDEIGVSHCVAVKHSSGFSSATSLHPSRAELAIRDGVNQALIDRASWKVFRLNYPATLEFEFKETVVGELAACIPGSRVSGGRVGFEIGNIIEGARLLTVITHLSA